MVNIINEPIRLNYGYRETNLQLARENNELRQTISHLSNENIRQREELHLKDVEILRLKSRNEKLENKMDTVVDLILEDREIRHRTLELSRGQSTNQRPLSLPAPDQENELGDSISDLQDQGTTMNETSRGLDKISECSERDEDSTPSPSVHNEKTYNDSLDPPDCTSVSPLKPERVVHTPSIWNCLDTGSPSCVDVSNIPTIQTNAHAASPIRPPNNRKGPNQLSQLMLESTPVLSQANKQAAASRVTPPNRPIEAVSLKSFNISQENAPKSPQKVEMPASKGRKVTKTTKRDAPPSSTEPTRYNLRKRTKL